MTILSLLNAETLREYYRDGHWRDETIYGVARGWADASPEKPAIRDRHRRLTYRQLLDAADAFAADLHRRGVRRGERVALWMPDRIESAVAMLACSRNGLVCCPSPHRNHTVDDVTELAERMRAVAFVHQTGFGADSAEPDVAAALGEIPSLRHFYALAPPGPDLAKTAPFDGLLLETGEHDCPAPVSDPNRVIYLAFTSGSTGKPKGVMHSDNTLLVTARAISRDWGVGGANDGTGDQDGAVYTMSPFSHNLGLGALFTSLVGGAEFVVHDRARGESLAERIVETGITYLVGVPTHAIDLLAEMNARGMGGRGGGQGDGLGQVSCFRVSGAASPAHLFEGLIEKGVPPQSGYGMTETNAHQYTMPGDDPDLIAESCGKACAGYEVRIWDEDDPDRELPPGEIGVVGGRGACLMLGYFDDQNATETAFNSDGWFLTGDLGRVDGNGYLRLTGRKKEVIIRGGHNINPAQIEALAMRHREVERAAAIPVADDRLGERVCLAVMYKPGARADSGADAGAERLLDHLADAGLSKYEMPEFFLALDDIPLMSNGKIQKLDIVNAIEAGRVTPIELRAEQKPK